MVTAREYRPFHQGRPGHGRLWPAHLWRDLMSAEYARMEAAGAFIDANTGPIGSNRRLWRMHGNAGDTVRFR